MKTRLCRDVWFLWLVITSVCHRFRLGLTLSPSCPVENCSPDPAALACAYVNKQWRCKQCAPGFASFKQGRACVCPEGSFQATGGCAPCPLNSYCRLSQAPTPCPGALVTARIGAKSLNDCVNPPGYRYVPRTSMGIPGIAPCDVDTYSIGYGKQLICTACPAGFKTKPDNLAGSQTGPDVCKAPPGYIMQGSGMSPCPRGTYRSGYGEPLDECIPCSDARGQGATTAATAATTVQDCFAVEPGFAVLNKWGAMMWATTSDLSILGKVKGCPQNWYCPGGSVLPGGTGVPIPCPGGLKTRQEGARDVSQCVAPPGFKLVPGTNSTLPCSAGNDTTPAEYKSSWDRSTSCVSCGVGPWRSADRVAVWVLDPSTGNRIRSGSLVKGLPTACYLRKGMGSIWWRNSTVPQLLATPCPANFYGVPTETYGLKVTPCRPCAVNQVTLPGDNTYRNAADFPSPTNVAFFSRAACVHQVGYGWVNVAWSDKYGSVNSALVSEPCLLDSWSAGGHNSSCTACSPNTYTSARGSESSASCSAGNLGSGQRMLAVRAASSIDDTGVYQSLDQGSTFSGLQGTSGDWVSVATSAHGQYILALQAGASQEYLKAYLSSNYGRSWSTVGDLSWLNLRDVACSSTGQYMVVVGTDAVFISNDYGVVWKAQNKAGPWVSVAMDSNGARVAAVQSGSSGGVAIATRLGSNWLWANVLDPVITDAGGNWAGVYLSSDGTRFAAVQSSATGNVYTGAYSTSWSFSLANDAVLNASSLQGSWSAVASNSAGNALLVCQSDGTTNGQLFRGDFDGAQWTWTQLGNLLTGNWAGVAASQDFSTLAAVQQGGGDVYVSVDSGSTWTTASGAGSGDWRAVAMSQ